MRVEVSGLTIGEAAAATGLSAHTLRYYEGEGLIPQVERDASGRRRYRPEHLRWIGLLDRLRVSGMSIARMREYVELAVRGDATASARRALLERHEADIRLRIAELEGCRAIVRAKIDLYAGRISDPSEVWALVEAARRRDAVRGRGLRSTPA
jgi:DNA-binding transcriptional MerR regulator